MARTVLQVEFTLELGEQTAAQELANFNRALDIAYNGPGDDGFPADYFMPNGGYTIKAKESRL